MSEQQFAVAYQVPNVVPVGHVEIEVYLWDKTKRDTEHKTGVSSMLIWNKLKTGYHVPQFSSLFVPPLLRKRMMNL